MSSHLDDTLISQDNNVGMQLADTVNDRPVSPALPEIPSPVLPEIPAADLDLFSILGSSNAEVDKVHKRASNVLKLSQENEKLKQQLKAMTDRLEAAERRREELARKEQQRMGTPPS